MSWTEKKNIFKNCIYLEDSGIEIDGIRFWGSPTNVIEGFNWAFNDKIQERIDKIPNDTDVLITHGPAKGILDKLSMRHGGENIGSQELLEKIKQINPKIHCFGHIHEEYGAVALSGRTVSINAAMQNDIGEMIIDGKQIREPWVIEI